MPNRSLRLSQLIEMNNVAAGHEGAMSDKTGALFIKPCKQAEIDFYQVSQHGHDGFHYYMPRFFGSLSLNKEAPISTSDTTAEGEAVGIVTGLTAATSITALTPSAANDDPASRLKPKPDLVNSPISLQSGIPLAKDPGLLKTATAQPWTPSNGGRIAADTGVVLENAVSGFLRPNVLDVKLGARLWADDAPPAKRQRLDDVAAETTSGTLGFRVAGMNVWLGRDAAARSPETSGYMRYDKKYGRQFTIDNVSQAFRNYFNVEDAGITGRLARRVIRRFLADLKDLKEILEAEESRMYSASLLFVYEGDEAALEEKLRLTGQRRQSNPNESDGETLLKEESNKVGMCKDNKEKQAGSDLKAGDESLDGSKESSNEDEPLGFKTEELKVIDFAHAAWTPGQGPDENMLLGIRNVISVLEGLIASSW